MTSVNDYILRASEYEQIGNLSGMYKSIQKGLRLDPTNYELYYMLGFYYMNSNINQAYLCFQNALFLCDNTADCLQINASIEELVSTGLVTVKNTSIIIVSYNLSYMMEKNIEAIRSTLLEGSYNIIVVDNASTDGVTDYLKNQNDILLYCNNTNEGFSKACNKGVSIAVNNGLSDTDIFLLNNDTRLAANSLFWLKMGLYENDKTGACGSISNYAGNNQQIDMDYQLPAEYLNFGKYNNIPLDNPYEERVRLSGFAMLIRAGLWQAVGGMDEDFTPGYFEDDDLCMKIQLAGYKLKICKNSFIYHAGSQSFIERTDTTSLLIEHHKLFCDKYQFDILDSCYNEIDFSRIPYKSNDEFNLLYLGCHLGAEIKYIRSNWPKANIIGLEENTNYYKVVSKTELVFDSFTSLLSSLQSPIFNVIVISSEVFCHLSEDISNRLANLCLHDCTVIKAKKLPQRCNGQPLLSICIPSYNRGHRALNLVNQILDWTDFDQIEVILSNNGSTKHTDEYKQISSISDPRFIYHEFDDNKFFYGNFNKVIKLASGKFCMLLSDEDGLDYSILSNFLAFLNVHQDAGIIKVGSTHMYHDIPQFSIAPGINAVKAFFLKGNYISGTVYSRNVVTDELIDSLCAKYEKDEGYFYYPHLFIEALVLNTNSFYTYPPELIVEGIDEGDIPTDKKTKGVRVFATYESRLMQMKGFFKLIKESSINESIKQEMYQITINQTLFLINLSKETYCEEGSNWNEIETFVQTRIKELCDEYKVSKEL